MCRVRWGAGRGRRESGVLGGSGSLCVRTPFSQSSHVTFQAIWSQKPPAVSQRGLFIFALCRKTHVEHVPSLHTSLFVLPVFLQSAVVTLVAEPVTMTAVPPFAADVLPENQPLPENQVLVRVSRQPTDKPSVFLLTV